MSINGTRFIYLLMASISTISSAIPALANDECELPTLPGIDVSQVKIVKHISTRDRSLENHINPKQYSVSENSFFTYSYNKVDLDGDGKPEILLRVTSSLCGSGGCQISILKFDGRKYITIDESLSFGRYIITSHRTNGFKDIIVPYFRGMDKMYLLLQYKGLGKGYQKVKEYTSNLKIKGTTYLNCGTYHDLQK
jgi:hypothetical protein